MMNRLRCTYTQLEQEPRLEMEVFYAFAAGEADEERSQRYAKMNQERVVQN